MFVVILKTLMEIIIIILERGSKRYRGEDGGCKRRYRGDRQGLRVNVQKGFV